LIQNALKLGHWIRNLPDHAYQLAHDNHSIQGIFYFAKTLFEYLSGSVIQNEISIAPVIFVEENCSWDDFVKQLNNFCFFLIIDLNSFDFIDKFALRIVKSNVYHLLTVNMIGKLVRSLDYFE
jgi:hypothetical protein